MNVLERRGIVGLESFEGDGGGNHREGEMVANSFGGVNAARVGNFEAEGQMTRRKIGALQDIGEAQWGTT